MKIQELHTFLLQAHLLHPSTNQLEILYTDLHAFLLEPHPLPILAEFRKLLILVCCGVGKLDEGRLWIKTLDESDGDLDFCCWFVEGCFER